MEELKPCKRCGNIFVESYRCLLGYSVQCRECGYYLKKREETRHKQSPHGITVFNPIMS